MRQGRNHWNPQRVALCPCGWATRGTRREVTQRFEQHAVEGTEGCDHAVHIELMDKEITQS